MPTYYVEDYDGERNKDAVEPLTLKVVAPAADDAKPAPKATERAQTKKSA